MALEIFSVPFGRAFQDISELPLSSLFFILWLILQLKKIFLILIHKVSLSTVCGTNLKNQTVWRPADGCTIRFYDGERCSSGRLTVQKICDDGMSFTTHIKM